MGILVIRDSQGWGGPTGTGGSWKDGDFQRDQDSPFPGRFLGCFSGICEPFPGFTGVFQHLGELSRPHRCFLRPAGIFLGSVGLFLRLVDILPGPVSVFPNPMGLFQVLQMFFQGPWRSSRTTDLFQPPQAHSQPSGLIPPGNTLSHCFSVRESL